MNPAAELAAAWRRLQRIADLHTRADHASICVTCGRPWPCHTNRIALGEEPE